MLVMDMVQDGLSQLGISGDGTKIVYLTLALNVSGLNFLGFFCGCFA